MGLLSDFHLKSSGMGELLKSAGVRSLLAVEAEAALARAQGSAPVDTGAYRSSLHIEEVTTDRAVARVVANAPHAMIVEANTGNLARSL